MRVDLTSVLIKYVSVSGSCFLVMLSNQLGTVDRLLWFCLFSGSVLCSHSLDHVVTSLDRVAPGHLIPTASIADHNLCEKTRIPPTPLLEHFQHFVTMY